MILNSTHRSALTKKGRFPMELYSVMRTTFAAREFTQDPVPDVIVKRILDNARFAPSGGNRQGWHVIVVREAATRAALADLAVPAAKRYLAQVQAGEHPWNSVESSSVDPTALDAAPRPSRLTHVFSEAPVLLVVCVDLRLVASTDKELDRVGIVSGASIYPCAWNILLAARNEGFGGTITTFAVAQEPLVQELLHVPRHVAICAVMPLGRPVKQLSRLRRLPVSDFTTLERWDGAPMS